MMDSNTTKLSKEWHKGRLVFDLDANKQEWVKQANSECQYLHLEKIEENEFIVSIIGVDDQQITFRLQSGSPILCRAEFQNEDMKHESFPFAEKK